MTSWDTHTQAGGRENFEVDVRYTNFEPIGDGSYGFVCSADDNATGKRVAVKKVKDIFRNLGDAKRILRELKLLRHFRPHENVVTILDIMVYPKNSLDFRDVYIVTNLMESDLQKIISSTQPLTDQHFHYFLYQLLRGLKYIHSANVLHRDLKPSNLVLNANCDLAICDFGLARGVEEGGETLTEYVQTRWYRAPELLCYASTYDTAVDMWSVGCIFAELLGRRPFFQGKNPIHQLKMIVDVLGCPSEQDLSFIQDKTARAVVFDQARQARASSNRGTELRALSSYFPSGTSPLALDLLARMLVFDPKRRICVEEALEHPYLRDLHAQMLGKEPVCPNVFDFDFEKEVGDGDQNGFRLPKSLRVIPIAELKALVLEEVLAYRPSPEDAELLRRAKQASAKYPQQRQESSTFQRSTWSGDGMGIAAMDAHGFDAFSVTAQVALSTPSPMGVSPMDSGIAPGLVTPNPGVHGYAGAMAYSRAVPSSLHSRGGSSSQQQQQQERTNWEHRQHPRTDNEQQQQQSQGHRYLPHQQRQHYPYQFPTSGGSGSCTSRPSPMAVAAAIAAATAASTSPVRYVDVGAAYDVHTPESRHGVGAFSMGVAGMERRGGGASGGGRGGPFGTSGAYPPSGRRDNRNG